MTEAEWLACANPTPMLEFLRDMASDRKVRLFAVACCRRISHLLTDDRSRIALDVAERHADGVLSHEDWLKINRDANLAGAELRSATEEAIFTSTNVEVKSVYASAAVSHLLGEPVSSRANIVAACAGNAAGAMPTTRWSHHNCADRIRLEEMETQCRFLRDIFGNPFHPVALDPAWRTSDVVMLAKGINEDRAFDRLPILAGALMDAGCTNDDVLKHCRGSGPHVRGCWVVDLFLGKS